MNLDVLRLGVMGAFGRGPERLAAALAGPVPPPFWLSHERTGARIPVRRVEDSLLQDPVLNPARRAGRFIKLALLAASDCLRDSPLDAPARDRMGLVLVTGMGAHDVNFGFCDGLLEFGMNQGSPTHFSHSVHNAATSYVATMSACHGPAATLTHFAGPLHQGLAVAGLWLEGGSCDHVLLTAVDELGLFMLAVQTSTVATAGDGVLRSLQLDSPIGIVPGEGATCLLLSRPGLHEQRVGRIRTGTPTTVADLVVLDHDGLGSRESVLPAEIRARPLVSPNALWGSFPCGSGLALAASLIFLRQAPPARPRMESDDPGLTLWPGGPAPRSVLCHTHRPGLESIEVTS